MALNYKTGTETQTAVDATTNSSTIDLAGYSKLDIATKFGTCTGTTNTASLNVQTSNDNSTWFTVLTVWSHADMEDASTDTYHDYIPDSDAANQIGFGRYIRFNLTATGTFAATYTIHWIAKE